MCRLFSLFRYLVTGLTGKVFSPEICKINSYLETGSKPVNTRAEEGLSQIATGGIRDVAEEYDLSKATIVGI